MYFNHPDPKKRYVPSKFNILLVSEDHPDLLEGRGCDYYNNFVCTFDSSPHLRNGSYYILVDPIWHDCIWTNKPIIKAFRKVLIDVEISFNDRVPVQTICLSQVENFYGLVALKQVLYEVAKEELSKSKYRETDLEEYS